MSSSTLTLRRTGSPIAGMQVNLAPAAYAASSQPAERAISPQAVASEQLLRGRPYVTIAHNGEIYQLRATRLGKLILTK